MQAICSCKAECFVKQHIGDIFKGKTINRYGLKAAKFAYLGFRIVGAVFMQCGFFGPPLHYSPL